MKKSVLGLRILLVAAFSTVFLSPIVGSPLKPAETSTVRKLEFPPDHAIGGLLLVPAVNAAGKNAWSNAKEIAIAQGSVSVPVPKDKALMLELNLYAWQHPECLRQVSPSGIDSLKASFRMMDDDNKLNCDKVLEFIPYLKGIAFLDLESSDATDAGLANVKSMKNLKVIYLTGCPVHGNCLKEFCSLPELMRLIFVANPLEMTSLKYLGRMQKLTELKLDNVKLNEDGVKSIAECHTLQKLWVPHNTAVSDKCVPYLRSLKNLRTLDLRRTSISVRGVKSLASLEIRDLWLPRSEYSSDDMASLNRAFPNTHLYTDKGHPNNVDDSTKALLAPLTLLPELINL
ncbi:MAG TPA: hypothetical protein V6C86_07365 [Oculatellaceae cyanobacterium]